MSDRDTIDFLADHGVEADEDDELRVVVQRAIGHAADNGANLSNGELQRAFRDLFAGEHDTTAVMALSRILKNIPKEPGTPSHPLVRQSRQPRQQIPADSFGGDFSEETLNGVELSGDPVRDYLRVIGKVPLINAEQEVAIAKRIEAGVFADEALEAYVHEDNTLVHTIAMRNEMADDQALLGLRHVSHEGELARAHLIEANLRLVVSIAKRYRGLGLELLDLIQEGNGGLMRAVEKFDYARGYKFSTYATGWIRQAITRSLADKSRNIRLPVHVVETINKIKRFEREFLTDMNRTPTTEEVAANFDMTVQKVLEVQKHARDTVSLATPLGGDGEGTLGDIVYDDTAPFDELVGTQAMRSEAIEFYTKYLTVREAEVVVLRYGLGGGEPMTLDAIGKKLGITRERVRQIQKKAEGKMKTTPEIQRYYEATRSV